MADAFGFLSRLLPLVRIMKTALPVNAFATGAIQFEGA
jgi:hypothetical protein